MDIWASLAGATVSVVQEGIGSVCLYRLGYVPGKSGPGRNAVVLMKTYDKTKNHQALHPCKRGWLAQWKTH